MIRAGLTALLSHWLRHPIQLAMLLIGLALATALWSGVQAINAEARAAYAKSAALLGQDRLDRIVARDGSTIPDADYVQLRRNGWLVSPLVEGRLRPSGVRVIGVDPLTLPADAAVSNTLRTGAGDVAAFLGGTQGFAHPDTIADMAGSVVLGDLALAPATDLPPMTIVVDIGVAKRLLQQPDTVNVLVVATGRQPDLPLPEGLSIGRADEAASLSRLTDSFHLNLTAFGFLAFAVGIFIVYSAIGLAFEQRRPMFRTLRAMGLSAETLAALIVLELMLLSTVAGLVGIALGYVVAAALLPDVAATLDGLYGASVPGDLSIRTEWWVSGIAMAVIGTLTAAGKYLWQIWHLPILAAAQPQAWSLAAALHQRSQFKLALCLFAAAVGLLVFGSNLWTGFGGLAGLLLGSALALPTVLDLIIRPLRQTRSKPIWDWFWADTRQQLPGLSIALMALMLALAANIGVGTMVASFRSTFTGWLDQRLASELYLTTRSEDEAARIIAWLEPRTDAILPIISTSVGFQGMPGSLYAIADHATYRENWPLLQAQTDVWDRISDGTGILINEQMARRSEINLGDIVDLPGGALPVVGVYSDYGNPSPQAIIGLDGFSARFPSTVALRFGLRLAPEMVAPLMRDLRATFDLGDDALVDQAGIKAFSLQIFERTFTVTAALNVLTLGVASLAMFANLLSLATLRQSQLAPVWAMGLTLRHLAGLDLARTLLLALFAGLTALPVGLALAWVLLSVVNVEAFGWRVPMQIFPADWLKLGLFALLSVAFAALIPAVQLARRTPSDLIKVFANER